MKTLICMNNSTESDPGWIVVGRTTEWVAQRISEELGEHHSRLIPFITNDERTVWINPQLVQAVVEQK